MTEQSLCSADLIGVVGGFAKDGSQKEGVGGTVEISESDVLRGAIVEEGVRGAI